MKKFTVLVILFCVVRTFTFAQCDKNIVLTSSTAEHIDAKGNIKSTTKAPAIIKITKTNITISLSEDQKATGEITSQTCDWKIPFKEGKTVIQTVLTNAQGNQAKATVTITGKDGKVTLMFTMDEIPDDITKAYIDKFEDDK